MKEVSSCEHRNIVHPRMFLPVKPLSLTLLTLYELPSWEQRRVHVILYVL
jgi:hypothetical protein